MRLSAHIAAPIVIGQGHCEWALNYLLPTRVKLEADILNTHI